MTNKAKRTCRNGHTFYKSSDCPTCPYCEKERKPQSGLLSHLVAPARRALENAGISTTAELSNYTEAYILSMHGIGSSTIPKLKDALEKDGLSF